MMRLFSTGEDFTKDIVQVQLLIRDDGVFKRQFVKGLAAGKMIKIKKKWEKLQISEKELMKKACGFRKENAYKLHFEGRFFYAAKVKPSMGPE